MAEPERLYKGEGGVYSLLPQPDGTVLAFDIHRGCAWEFDTRELAMAWIGGDKAVKARYPTVDVDGPPPEC